MGRSDDEVIETVTIQVTSCANGDAGIFTCLLAVDAEAIGSVER